MTVLAVVFFGASIVIFAVAVAASPGAMTMAPMALLVAGTAWLARGYMKKALFWLAYDEALLTVVPRQRGAQTGENCRPRR